MGNSERFSLSSSTFSARNILGVSIPYGHGDAWQRKALAMHIVVRKKLSYLNSFNVRALFRQECGLYGVAVRPSSILHPKAGMGCCESQDLAKEGPLGLYCCTLVYKNIAHNRKPKIYGEGILAVAPRDFQTSPIQLHQFIKCRKARMSSNRGYDCSQPSST